MRRLVILMAMVMLVLSLSTLAMGEDSKEVLTLKRDLAQERVLRIQSQLSLMNQQFSEGQKYLKEVVKELDDLNARLKALEAKKESPKPEPKK